MFALLTLLNAGRHGVGGDHDNPPDHLVVRRGSGLHIALPAAFRLPVSRRRRIGRRRISVSFDAATWKTMTLTGWGRTSRAEVGPPAGARSRRDPHAGHPLRARHPGLWQGPQLWRCAAQRRRQRAADRAAEPHGVVRSGGWNAGSRSGRHLRRSARRLPARGFLPPTTPGTAFATTGAPSPTISTARTMIARGASA